MKKFIIFLLLACIASATPYTFLFQPPAGTWAAAGVTGGIPTNRTQSGSTITATSGDRTAFIQSALTTAASGYTYGGIGKYVLLGTGTFEIDTTLRIPAGVTLRGSGNTTVLDARSSAGSCILMGPTSGGDPNDHWPTTGQTVSSAVTQGTTTLTVPSTTAFVAGTMMRIEVANQQNNTLITAGAVPVIDIHNGVPLVRTQIVKLVSKTSSVLTISPGLLWDSTGLTVTARPGAASGDFEGCAIESLKLDCSLAGNVFPVYMLSNRDCWVYDTEIYHPNNGYGIVAINGLTCTIQKIYNHGTGGGGSNGGGITFGANYGSTLTGDGVCSSLVQDNIISASFPSIEVNFSSSGNVFGYNYCYDSTSSTANGASIDANHGPHNCFNLYEGNIAPNIEPDGFFGSVSEDSVFRNYFYGTNPSVSDRATVLLKRMTRRYQVISNRYGGSVTPYQEVGQPNIGNQSSSGTAQPALSDFWVDWPGSYADNTIHYQELDLDVAASSTFLGNYYNSGTVISGESLSGQTLPDSLYLPSKPAWFYGLTYPIDPSATLTQQANPAGYRFANGGANPPSGTTGGSTVSGKITTSGKVTIQ